MHMQEVLYDPKTQTHYNYSVRDAKEQRLLDALKMSLKDECPPDRKDYLCIIDATEDSRCAECILRWATRNFRDNT